MTPAEDEMNLETPLPLLIAATADSDPERPFIEEAGTDVVHSYGHFHDEVLRWAGAFAALGVAEGSYVATMMPNCLDSYRAWLGLSWLRAVEVPINPHFIGRSLMHPLNNSAAEVLVIAAEFLERLDSIAGDLPHLRTVVVLASGSATAAHRWTVLSRDEFLDGAETPQLRKPQYHDVHAVIYTSGTTGPSKGVLQPWVNLHGMARGIFPDEEPGSQPEGATFTCWPTFHSSGKFGMCIAPAFGLRMVFRPTFSADEFWSDIRRHHVTHAPLLVVSTMLMARDPEPDDALNPLSLVGMYPLIPQYREFEKRFGVTVSAGYGTTESGWAVTTGSPVDHTSNGRPAPGYQIRIVNEQGEQLPTGAVGEIVVRHDLPWRLNRGYLGMPEATAEAWRDGWFHTGDAGRFDEDGNIAFVDRLKDSLRRRGHNVSSFEVESEVLAHPDVAECACIGVPSSLAGEEEVVKDDDVKVFIVLHAGSTLAPRELIEFLTPRAPRFMIPRYVEIVDALPRTETGKVRKVELRERANHAWDAKAQGGPTTEPTGGAAAGCADRVVRPV